MTYLHEREILSRFKLSLASNDVKKLIKVLNEEEINYLIESVNELGYDSNIITSNITKKEEIKVEEKSLPNALEEHVRLRKLRTFM